MRDVVLKNYNNLLISSRWSTNDLNYSQILDIVGVSQKISYDSNKASENSNLDLTNVKLAYISDLPPWILEEPKG